VFPTERVCHTAQGRPADPGKGLRHTQHVDLEREHERWTSIEGEQWLVRARLHLLATESDRLSRWVELRGGSSNHASRLKRPADALPSLSRRRLRSTTARKRQVQRRLDPEKAEQLVAEYQAGVSMLKLSRTWRLHRTTVAEHLRRACVRVRHRGIPAEQLSQAMTLAARCIALPPVGAGARRGHARVRSRPVLMRLSSRSLRLPIGHRSAGWRSRASPISVATGLPR